MNSDTVLCQFSFIPSSTILTSFITQSPSYKTNYVWMMSLKISVSNMFLKMSQNFELPAQVLVTFNPLTLQLQNIFPTITFVPPIKKFYLCDRIMLVPQTVALMLKSYVTLVVLSTPHTYTYLSSIYYPNKLLNTVPPLYKTNFVFVFESFCLKQIS